MQKTKKRHIQNALVHLLDFLELQVLKNPLDGQGHLECVDFMFLPFAPLLVQIMAK